MEFLVVIGFAEVMHPAMGRLKVFLSVGPLAPRGAK
jgi:hypothetical protein